MVVGSVDDSEGSGSPGSVELSVMGARAPAEAVVAGAMSACGLPAASGTTRANDIPSRTRIVAVRVAHPIGPAGGQVNSYRSRPMTSWYRSLTGRTLLPT